jgi:hypothetical protein
VVKRSTGLAPDLNDAFAKYTSQPPALADTAAIATAFLEAGQSPDQGESAGPLGRAMEFVHQAAVVLDPQDVRHSDVVQYCFHPSIEPALAIDAMLAFRAACTDHRRAQFDGDVRTLLARLKGRQARDGSWPLHPRVSQTLAAVPEQKYTLQRNGLPMGRYENFPTSKGYLGDAVIFRTLRSAARAGFDVDPEPQALARDRLLAFHDPASGGTGSPQPGDPDDFYQTAAVCNVLYQLDRDAEPGHKPATADALARAHAAFFARLRDANARTPKDQRVKLGAAVVVFANPNPLDRDKGKEVEVNVPISSVDLVAYFLLIESLQSSTHPDARKFAAGITDVLARRQSPVGTWGDRSHSDAALLSGYQPGPPNLRQGDPVIGSPAFVTAYAVRTLLLPLPPEPSPPAK